MKESPSFVVVERGRFEVGRDERWVHHRAGTCEDQEFVSRKGAV